jgi:uncharacterized protein
MRDFLARVAARAVERPTAAIALAVLLTLVAAIAALRLQADRDPASLVDHGSDAFAATERFYEQFGGEPVRILVEGDLEQLLRADDLSTLLAFEACLSGSAPEGQVFGPERPAPAACPRLAEERPARVVFGPATFLNQSAITAQELLGRQQQAALREARAAGRRAALEARRQGLPEEVQAARAEAAAGEVLRELTRRLVEAGERYGLTGIPTLDDPEFVNRVVFDPERPGEPKSRFSFLFPSADAALITVRLRPDLSQGERERALALFRDAAASPEFELEGASYVVSGVPVIFDGLAEEVSDQVFILLAVALAVMAITLALVFGPPLRLLPLAIALGAVALTFGVLAVVGGSLTMASIAVLPVLIGLAVDYAIQLQARFAEAVRGGSSPAAAAVEAAARGGPMILTALVATSAGFIVLLLSPIPMVRGFGVLLVVGVALAFVLALTAGLATLSLSPPMASPRPANRRAEPRSARAVPLRNWSRRMLAVSIAAPGRVLAVALVVAAVGWVAGTRAEVVTDIRELLPSNLPELEDAERLEQATGVSGDVYVTVEARDLADPRLIAWMEDFEDRVLEAGGAGGEDPSCTDEGARICPGLSLATLFSGQPGAPSRSQVERLLAILPSYFSEAVLSRGETGGGTALIGFGIRVMPLDEQKQLIDEIRALVDPPGAGDDPPPGTEVEVVGLPVLAADATSALEGNRYLLTVAGLVAVALALLAVYRSLNRALVPLIPVVLATGWSALVVAAIGVPLNPLSATLGALVIAIATEFSVILSARYREERAGGSSVGEALRRAYERTGAAVAASGATAIAGFAVLALAAPIEAIFGADAVPMLTDFGLVTVLDLAVALIGVLLVLPAALVWAESGFAPFSALARRIRGRRAAVPDPGA